MGPLDHPGLRLIEEQINRGELPRAQQHLAALGDSAALRHGTSFLATRLLFERGRLEPHEVAERLRDLLKLAAPFPEAEAMLKAAEEGSLTVGAQPKPEALPNNTKTLRHGAGAPMPAKVRAVPEGPEEE